MTEIKTEAIMAWPLVAHLLASATKALDGDRVDTARRYIAHALAVAEGLGRRPLPEANQGGLAPWQVHELIAYLEANVAARITLADMSEVAQLSTSHFSRAFKRNFGTTPHGFLLQRRIEYAKQLMLTTDAPLAQIALACGLSDQAHLSRLFQHIVGSSPNAWRRVSRIAGQQRAPQARTSPVLQQSPPRGNGSGMPLSVDKGTAHVECATQ
jgi:AraC family transcriptional regulator